MTANGFHNGERLLQNKVGVEAKYIERFESAIRQEMPDQHRKFFEALSMMVTGALDNEGRPWASAFFGSEGFVLSPSSDVLQIDGLPLLHEELNLSLNDRDKLGLLGILPEYRRRNRMNGYIERDAESFKIYVDQSFGNCPQYIQKRSFEPKAQTKPNIKYDADIIDSDSKKLIEASDTFFIASRTADIDADPKNGIDVSHRGGNPGFVKLLDDKKLIFPDFSGNRFFNTLGNIELDDRVGLWFPDFETGDSVFLTGQAHVIWDEDSIKQFDGALRLIEVTVTQIFYVSDIIPLSGTLIEMSPTLRKTGMWK